MRGAAVSPELSTLGALRLLCGVCACAGLRGGARASGSPSGVGSGHEYPWVADGRFALAPDWTIDTPSPVPLDTIVSHSGRTSVTVRRGPGMASNSAGTTYVTQCVGANQYPGRHTTYTRSLRLRDVSETAHLTPIFVQDTVPVPLGRDQMGERHPTGTASWPRYAAVLDVRALAAVICLGVASSGVDSPLPT